MRNNEDRLGTNVQDQETPQLSPLNFVTPTFFVDLPSKGKFYPEGHPLHNQEQVEVKEMTAYEEDLLTSKSLIQNGVVLNKLMDSVLVDKNIKGDSLIIGDKNAVLVELRGRAYGYDYKTKVKCPSCGEASRYEFSLFEPSLIEPSEQEGVTYLENSNVMIELSNGWKIECKMLNGVDEHKIFKANEMKKKKKIDNQPHLDLYSSIVVSIDGHTDKDLLSKGMMSLPSRLSREFKNKFQNSVPNVDLRQEFECSHCNYSEEMEVPLTAEFFWPND